MLRRLLSRDTKSKIAKRAKTALDAQAQGVAAPEPTVEPAPVARPAPTPPVARRAKSMRDSDVKDELGRTAEQLAAEAAKEFDIIGLAARVADMEERPDRPRKSATAITGPGGEFGVLGAPSPASTPPASPVVQVVAEKRDQLQIDDGHIALPNPPSGAVEASYAARDAYWDRIGVSEAELLGYPLCPELKGAPAWPTQTQAFRIVRTDTSMIIASEGLSDPFAPFHGPADINGFGLEVFIELHQWPDTDAKALRAGWAFKAIEQFARLCAHAEGLHDALNQHGVMSLDLPMQCAPTGWVVPGIAEPVGALANLPLPPGRAEIADMPLSKVRMVPLTLIFPEELEDCIVGGADERRALANDLLTTGAGHRTDPKRSSLR